MERKQMQKIETEMIVDKQTVELLRSTHDKLEEVIETMDILSDSTAMNKIREAEVDLQKGNISDWYE